MHQLKIITSTTRQERKGPIIANWIHSFAEKSPIFEAELLDLAEIDLPLLDEPYHPRLKTYQYDHTKRWSKMIDSADAFIFVMAEYNHSFPAPIKNALDYLNSEWNYKPVGFVSYGGISAGTRSVNALMEVVTTLKMVPLSEAVNIPFYQNFINEDGVFVPNDITVKAADNMLNELVRWTETLKSMRIEEAV